jgi:hypothetical protein
MPTTTQQWRRARKADKRHLSGYDRRRYFGKSELGYTLVSIGPYVSEHMRALRIKRANGPVIEMPFLWRGGEE